MKPRLITNYKKVDPAGDSQSLSRTMLTSYPTETLVEKDKKYTEQKILIPEFSVPGILAKQEWEGLVFHFMAFPTIFEYTDFRLVDENKYELLGFNGKSVSEFTAEYIAECISAMQVHFEQVDEPSAYCKDDETDYKYDKQDVRLLTGKVKWHFGTYLRQTTDDENRILEELREAGELEYEKFDEAFNYTTNYDLPVFKDEHGNTLVFVCRLHAAHFPGSHYLFYSPETKLVRQFSQFPKRKQDEIDFTETDDPDAYTNVIEALTDPSKVLTDRSYFDKNIILPKYSFPGEIISRKYEGLVFHFVITPIFNSSIDFRLTDNNKYELLRFDDKMPGDFTPDFLEECKMEMQEDFELMGEKTVYFFNIDESSDKEWKRTDLKLTVGTDPCWAQATLMRRKNEEEIQSDHDASNMMMYEEPFRNDRYVTDYDLPAFKDENDDKMELVAELNSDDVFGTYYLYFSPKTRLVRQFFQCT
ncbi:MAG: hypothetical protein LBE92_19305 [Chryseobacterium sp.]|jgi:hypothetical protein|uniref:hypothetical protein n=1 Tax=Chryseobacterium sp. TaxID=1871047 RepID=UPI00282062D0|nr:hypothetical protein [Chryseobacterium sp.]MDR2238278.1 hypothetical protein [Chryseobacterium sp.]